VSQLSLFSADARPAGLADLAGMLCGPAQIVRFGAGDQARLSVVLPDSARAPAVVSACGAIGVAAQSVPTENGGVAVRTAFRCDLVELAREWTRGAVKSVPAGWDLDGAALRMWVLSAGRPDERGGYLLVLDPHAPRTDRGAHPGRSAPGQGAPDGCLADLGHAAGATAGRDGRPATRARRRRGMAAVLGPRGVLTGLVTLRPHVPRVHNA
jgi:hypothetical protein